VVSMSGAFDIHSFAHGYWDDNWYFNCPPDYIANMYDQSTLATLRSGRRYVLAAGEHDICLNETLRLAGILQGKSIPHHLDVWGNGTRHDWPWWHQMSAKYFG
jgi:esterase/lipase superfamily enzyme